MERAVWSQNYGDTIRRDLAKAIEIVGVLHVNGTAFAKWLAT
jgi:hypothetical protein